MFVTGVGQFYAGPGQYLIHHATLLHGMLQRAGTMEGNFFGPVVELQAGQVFTQQECTQIHRQGGYFMRLVGVGWIVFQQVAIVLHLRTAA